MNDVTLVRLLVGLTERDMWLDDWCNTRRKWACTRSEMWAMVEDDGQTEG